MRRIFRNSGEKLVVTVEQVKEAMLEQGATGRECRGMERAVELFLEWGGAMGVATGREEGIAWLRERRQGMAVEAYEEMKAGLTTWFHLTGQAAERASKGMEAGDGGGEGGGELSGSSVQPLAVPRDVEWTGSGEGAGAVRLSHGGRLNGVAGTWREAGERFKGFLACKNYSLNTVECYVGWSRRFCRWCVKEGRGVPVVEAGEIRGFLEWLAGTAVGGKTQNLTAPPPPGAAALRAA